MRVVRPSEVVETGYDRIADQYLAQKDVGDPVTFAWLDRLAAGLPESAAVLDLGCGAGVPVTRWLAERYEVTGADFSARQLELAGQHVPRARLLKEDMTRLAFPPESFDAVVAITAIIHVSRAEQPALVKRIYHWLKPGGAFLATWALDAWEGEEENWQGWGARMWWSHHDQKTNLAMLRDAGFAVTGAEAQTTQDETWLWVLASRPAKPKAP